MVATNEKVKVDLKLEEKYGPFINGEFVEPSNGYINAINAANGKLLSKIARGGKEDIDRAVKAARQAFEGWANTPIEERSALLHKIADVLEANQERLKMIECMDTGRPIFEFDLDYKLAIYQFRYFASALLTYEGISRPVQNGYLIVKKEPLGVCAQIIPWNVPMIMVSFKLAPALAAGNTVVLKPAEDASLSTMEFAKLLQDILPKGVVNVVPGYGTEAGQALIDHPDVDKLAFTGSVGVGRLVGETAGRRLLPVTLELGGKAPHIVFPDVDIDRAVENATMGYTFFNGQSCILGTRLLIHEDIYDEFVEKLIARASEVKVGDPTDPSTRVSCLINKKQGKRVLGYFDIAREERAKILYGGNRVTVPGNEHGYFIEPTIIEAEPHMRISKEEIFGPACTVTRWSTVEEVIEMANNVEYGLAAGIMTDNLENALQTANKIQAGSVWINQYFNFQSGAPFGGYKNSGVGREYSKEALDHYSQSKTIVAAYQLPPAGAFK
ncbi:aldehyde dehydrogenase (acceptor) [Schinkia azotoformans MEV2011]|uniref:Aldehyde dehydrogenase (Acceptor) n=1 Tax=Schinkia azotoformans MEV2011 TaxID=1348973 RepID=A0A072NJB7_SCHAZ|nr:aldehyde dehydrogenase family protein [Schinkia azotoformans]KEF36988.1 aldehyde dehydrogenase (acceptor) [Schinkia azotoformans MEV2011]MEC1694415.1 aldehyde dehydrogenase family protein [Schinkia azotoformans]MEC1723226.1 aldehyde dehydrogenase family protein [Schinkia azotoformans]MEC1772155.1 aldehyde dehydrogenase family protein [Schinkia azotoformans]MEC1779153.1 aldehyde dehydrogenase family protein [Schinkia azotoformans]